MDFDDEQLDDEQLLMHLSDDEDLSESLEPLLTRKRHTGIVKIQHFSRERTRHSEALLFQSTRIVSFVWRIIVGFARTSRCLCRIAQTCVALHEMSSEDSIWEKVFLLEVRGSLFDFYGCCVVDGGENWNERLQLLAHGEGKDGVTSVPLALLAKDPEYYFDQEVVSPLEVLMEFTETGDTVVLFPGKHTMKRPLFLSHDATLLGCCFECCYEPNKNWSSVRDLPEAFVKQRGAVTLILEDHFVFCKKVHMKVCNIDFLDTIVSQAEATQKIYVESKANVSFVNCGFTANAYHGLYIDKATVSMTSCRVSHCGTLGVSICDDCTFCADRCIFFSNKVRRYVYLFIS